MMGFFIESFNSILINIFVYSINVIKEIDIKNDKF
jgi:hypothetical protein